ncbi:hypothetical protein VIBNISOn1_820063 [Vibrio nigripulchritudo SOn1]|uniref:Uncharacterized protein n=1 Tax=Vibrio nigripulchritudo SOn1 TaxID=1238450 RepID=A0AAV2VY02_9VIBR|nr:hypothetical protein VIBNIMADA3021_1210141 [Vibrio nigripulchritudo MADA3021]CCO49383.1 hypothetical protein VIBNISOn1_820063 [Vibrio nigripulchritudo SOn1]
MFGARLRECWERKDGSDREQEKFFHYFLSPLLGELKITKSINKTVNPVLN